MILLSLAPLLSILLLTCIFFFVWRKRLDTLVSLRSAIIASTITNSLFIAASTELLSAFESISFPYIVGAWLLFLGLQIGYAFKLKMPLNTPRQLLVSIIAAIRNNWLLLLVALLLLISLAVALIYPPNNYDSMTYHMGRVAHWEQNGSIEHYRTHIIRQLVYQPFAEWVILHLQILTGGDRLANAVQLYFFASALVALSLIVKLLGGDRRQQVLAIVLACTIPMAIIQSNTTQNDVVVAFFIVCFALVTIIATRKTKFLYIVAAGAILGLAWLTKGTAYLFTALFCLWYVLALFGMRHFPLTKILQRAVLYAMIPLIAGAMNYGHFSRNYFLNESILGKANEGTANEGFNLKAIAFVAAKNILNHMPVTAEVKNAVTRKAVEMNLEPDDPKYNYNTISWMMEGFSFHEDYAQNVIHTILIIIFALAFFLKRSLYSRPPDRYLLFVLTLIATSCLFTVLLKWQPWSNRLQIALFMLFCVFLAIEIGKLKTWLRYGILLPVIAYGCVALVQSQMHPILPISRSILKTPRSEFAYHTDLLPLKEYLKNKPHQTFGVDIGSDHFDYPLFTLLKTGDHKDRILKHIFVRNESNIYLDNFVPDAILTVQGGFDKITIQHKTYFKTGSFGMIHLYEPVP